MQTPKQTLKNYLQSQGYDLPLSPAPPTSVADFGMAVFALAKEKKSTPPKIAEELAEALKKNLPDFLAEITSEGGFVNFTLSQKAYSDYFTQELSFADKNPQTLVVDYGGENVAKPQSVGHLRSNIIGQAFVNIARAKGHKVITDNHLGDWGTQFGKLLVALEKWGNWEAIEKSADPIEELLALYTKFHIESEKDATLTPKAREYFARLANGDADFISKWQKICEWTIKNLKITYERLGVSYDFYYGDSFYREWTDAMVTECLDKKIAVENPDTSVAVQPDDDPSFLIRKSDGAILYITTDITAIQYRIEHFHPDRIVYFVAEGQSLHFRQAFWTAKKLGAKLDLLHAKFGTVTLPTGKMSTREGNIVRLSALLDEAEERAYQVILEKKPSLPEVEWRALAKKIGVGAVIYVDLVKDREKNVKFDWDTALAFEGQSAPYIMYTHARACSVLRKSDADGEFQILEAGSRPLLQMLLGLSDALEKAYQEAKPSYLAQWLYDLATEFNKFYTNNPILTAETSEQKSTRLYLTKKTQEFLAYGLNLLGLNAPKQM